VLTVTAGAYARDGPTPALAAVLVVGVLGVLVALTGVGWGRRVET
jgi:hypothetical protein